MSLGVAQEEVESTLTNAFNPSVLYVDDLSDGCGAKFGAIIVSSQFDGVSLLDRQQQVYEAMKLHMPKIHAFTMKCLTPKQWETRKDTVLAERAAMKN